MNNKSSYPIKYLIQSGYNFFDGEKKRNILKNKTKKVDLEWSIRKLKVWIFLCTFAYWPRNGGKARIKAQVLNWLGLDEITFIDHKVGLQCIIVASNIYKWAAVIFRGTDSVEAAKDWKINAKIGHKDFEKIFYRLKKYFPKFKRNKIPSDCGQGHTGFTHSVVTAFPMIWEPLKKYIKKGYDIDIGGHSKGGGEEKEFSYILAKLFKVKIRETFTMGQPRALDKTAAKEYNRLIKNAFRFCNPGDPVTYTPAGFRFDHTDKRFVLDRKGINQDNYDFAEFSSNLGRRMISLLKLEFLWGINRHYTPSYLKRVNKIYKKFDIDF